jgi:hypothetical protein
MPIAAASDALARHLRARLEEAGALEPGWSVDATTLSEVGTIADNVVALVLWRVQPDEPATGDDTALLRAASKADPSEGGGLKLRYLLTVRGSPAAAAQTMLGRCLAVLDQHPVVEAGGAAAGGGWAEAAALVIAVESLPDAAYLQLVEACGDPPPLLVPYAVRRVPTMPPTAGRVPDHPDTELP